MEELRGGCPETISLHDLEPSSKAGRVVGLSGEKLPKHLLSVGLRPARIPSEQFSITKCHPEQDSSAPLVRNFLRLEPVRPSERLGPGPAQGRLRKQSQHSLEDAIDGQKEKETALHVIIKRRFPNRETTRPARPDLWK